MVQTEYRPPNSCQPLCHCHCHLRQNTRSPSYLAGLFGQIFIGYKGLPLLSQSCTLESCKRNSAPNIYAIYFFPRWWILSRIILITARQRVNLGPEVLLRFPNRIHYNSPIVILVQQGKVEELKTLFAKGEASPNDLPTSGNLLSTLLHVSICLEDRNKINAANSYCWSTLCNIDNIQL